MLLTSAEILLFLYLLILVTPASCPLCLLMSRPISLSPYKALAGDHWCFLLLAMCRQKSLFFFILVIVIAFIPPSSKLFWPGWRHGDHWEFGGGTFIDNITINIAIIVVFDVGMKKVIALLFISERGKTQTFTIAFTFPIPLLHSGLTMTGTQLSKNCLKTTTGDHPDHHNPHGHHRDYKKHQKLLQSLRCRRPKVGKWDGGKFLKQENGAENYKAGKK